MLLGAGQPLACFAQANAYNLPDLGDSTANILTLSDEQKIGDSIMQEVRTDPAYLDDPELEEYLNKIGQRLVAASDRPAGKFTFFLVNDPTINAFAFPGGYIGVHTGLIMAAESESELASVLGHEIAHVTQRHIAQIFGKQKEGGLLMLASLLVAVLASGSSHGSEAALVMGQAGVLQSQLAYSRGFETEADRFGLQTLERAGFDPRGMVLFFERLQRSSRLYDDGTTPNYLRTHPLTQERISDMSGRVQQMPYRQVADSPEFTFVRAKLDAHKGMAVDAIRRLEDRITKHDDGPSHYALAQAYLRANRLDDARKQLAWLRRESVNTTFVEGLDAAIWLAAKKPGEAVAVLRKALQRYPGDYALTARLIGALLETGNGKEAAQLAGTQTRRNNKDQRMWALLARAESLNRHIAAQCRAQAEVFVLQGAYPAALEQLERARKVKDGDFYEQSAIDARYREVEALFKEAREERAGK